MSTMMMAGDVTTGDKKNRKSNLQVTQTSDELGVSVVPSVFLDAGGFENSACKRKLLYE
jgi:hypothetical protein